MFPSTLLVLSTLGKFKHPLFLSRLSPWARLQQHMAHTDTRTKEMKDKPKFLYSIPLSNSFSWKTKNEQLLLLLHSVDPLSFRNQPTLYFS
jgi:hypothetical protein